MFIFLTSNGFSQESNPQLEYKDDPLYVFMLNWLKKPYKYGGVSKNGIDSELLKCLLEDADNLKKMVIGASDLLTSPDPGQLLLQYAPQLPRMPVIPFFQVFDLEKELKRNFDFQDEIKDIKGRFYNS